MYQTESKIREFDALMAQLAQWRLKGVRVVWTNGCFDILHPGHVDYLEKAKSLGDKLVVGLNADASVKQLKGQDRPFFKENDRAKMLAALEFVDAIILFSDETPEKMIQAVKPEILAKGADYQEHEIIGAEFVKNYGGQVHRIQFLEGYSTSKLIDKIKA